MSNEYYTTKNAVHENEQNGHGVKRKLKIVSPCKLKDYFIVCVCVCLYICIYIYVRVCACVCLYVV